MSVTVDALYIYDDQNICILEHVYKGRPPSSQALISSFHSLPAPRPAIAQLSDLGPASTVYSVSHAALLVLCISSKDTQSLAILEFLHRVIDVFEDFLGSPLLASKIEDHYETIAQLLGEMCDGGVVCNTEPSALRESVELSSSIGKLFTQMGLPGSSPALGPSHNFAASLRPAPTLSNGPAIPWRKSNVRHTSNELYVDIVESLSVIVAPSGRPISARAHGSIAFTAKISGVPDLLLTLSAPGGSSSAQSSGIARTMQLPVFHPCVRLARWRERPGELSFVPPDGRFMLAGYETDLLPFSFDSEDPFSQSEKTFLPATVDLRTSLGASGSDFEARLTLNTNFPGVTSTGKPGSSSSRSASSAGPFSFGSGSGSSHAPVLEAVVVTIPLPPEVRTVTDLKASRGEANFNTWNQTVEWKVPTKDGASVNGVATLTGTVTGPFSADAVADEELDAAAVGKSNSMAGYYGEEMVVSSAEHPKPSVNGGGTSSKKTQATKALMPRSIAVSFNVKGWLPSGIKVDALLVDARKSKGLGDGVKPYKGVKYLTMSRQGVERRIS